MVSRGPFCSSFEFDSYMFHYNFIYYVNLVYDNKDFVVVVYLFKILLIDDDICPQLSCPPEGGGSGGA